MVWKKYMTLLRHNGHKKMLRSFGSLYIHEITKELWSPQ